MILTFDLLTSKWVHKLPVAWFSVLPILCFMGLSFLELGRGTPQTDRWKDGQTDRQTDTAAYFIMPPPLLVRGIISQQLFTIKCFDVKSHFLSDAAKVKILGLIESV